MNRGSSTFLRIGLLATASGLSLVATAAAAQTSAVASATSAEADTAGEIVVTARKRDETLISVPVAISAVTAETLSTRGVTNLESFSRLVPTLFISNSPGSFQGGGALGLRGISAGDSNVFADQAVAFNIDGVQIARSTPKQLSQFDLAQIEVLKGPQALYYGKNSPAGIVVIHTADPTDHFEAGAKAGYEFNGHEVRGEAYISGPLFGGINGRLAMSASHMRGWVHNTNPTGTLYSDVPAWSGKQDEFNIRTTLKYDRGGPFTARFKFNYGNTTGDGPYSNAQRVYCPLGTPQFGGTDDCIANNTVAHASIGTRFGTGGANTTTGAAIPGVYYFGKGRPFSRSKQYLAGLELKYDLTDQIQLASNTGYYDGRYEGMDNLNGQSVTTPTAIVTTYGKTRFREFSQEMRLSTNFDSMINGMIGGYYQKSKIDYFTAAGFNAVNPTAIYPALHLFQDGDAYSVFGSLTLTPVEQIEISGGARYSHETKNFFTYHELPGSYSNGTPYLVGQQTGIARPKRSFSNTSPEATISWRPNRNLTVYGGWRRGFLSGGYNGSGAAVAQPLNADNTYEQEIVEGWDGGVKALLLNGDLRLGLAAYSYKIKGLQVTVSLPTNPPTQLVNNAASATTKGVEADFDFKTPLSGLSLHGSLAYNRARYTSFPNSPCYGGQTIAAGCNLNLVGTAYTNQDLSGQPLVRAPEWVGGIGAAYQAKMADGGVFGLSVDGNYSSSFYTDTTNTPGGLQRAYWLLDASAHYKLPNGIDFALIGRNLTNKYYFQRSNNVTFTGTRAGLTTGTPSDQFAVISRGRQIQVQASYAF